ncbi:titin homolog [Cebidichthys violaceus]|uniref:titin homolog n=1 Tax=Cebidichthys violaceus TaxID=271503 RepID=UPI0035CAF74D
MLRIFETKWKKALTSILEELSPEEFRKLMVNLDKIPQVRKAEKHREEIPDIIIKSYGAEGSISVMDKEMKVVQRNDARVQEPLQRFVEKLKERRQKIKETAKKAATESGSVDKKPKPAAGTTSKSSSSASASAAKEPKPAVGLKSCQPDKKKTISQLSAQSSNESKRKMDPVVAMKTKQKTESTKTTKMDPVGAKTPKQKTERRESLDLSSLSLNPAVSTKPSKVQSDAVQTGRIKIIKIQSSNKRNTHLEVEFDGRQQQVFLTNRLLAEAFPVRADEDFTETLSGMTAEVKIQGNKITEINKNNRS